MKLLRFLQEGEYLPVGADRPRRVKARVIAATHQDLAAKERTGAFRRDLYYRLRTHRVHVPPLRARKDDLPLLLDHFLGEAARALGKRKPAAPRQLAQLLATHDFPGNVRELKSMVFDAVSVHKDRTLSMETFVEAIGRRGGEGAVEAGEAEAGNPFAGAQHLPGFDEALETPGARGHGPRRGQPDAGGAAHRDQPARALEAAEALAGPRRVAAPSPARRAGGEGSFRRSCPCRRE